MMKKQFSIIAIASALLMGVTSCNKDNSGGSTDSQGEGSINVTLGFQKIDETKAISTVSPKTAWVENIKDLQLVMVDPASSRIMVVRPIIVPATEPTGAFQSAFTGIPEGRYDAYVVANAAQTAGPAFYGETETAEPMTFIAGDNFNAKLYELKTRQPWYSPNEVAGSTGYTSPAEIFVGKAAGVVIAEGTPATPTIALTRAVSLLRVRLDVSNAVASGVDFTHADAGIRLRRHGKSLNLTTGAVALANPAVMGVYFSDKAFKNATDWTAKQSSYGAGAMLSDGYTLWNDYLILPGGGLSSAANEFNIAIVGFAPVGYTLADGSIVTAGDQLVWWQGAIKAAPLAANGILDVSIKFTTPGTGGPEVPPVVNYGNLDIYVNITNWAVPQGIEITM